MPPAAGSKLKIVRGGGYADMARAYKIFVNEELKGSIQRHSVLNLEAPSGPLKVEARVDWCCSEPLTVTAAPNQTVEIEVANRWGALLALWAVTFGRHSYLSLKRLTSS